MLHLINHCFTLYNLLLKTILIKTIRNLQNKRIDADWLLDKYQMFLNTPAEKLAVTITQHYNFVFANAITDPVRKAQVINECKQRQANNTLVDAY